jgi:dipeptidyl aminopeptidase/acylaminoacyl peptidase
MAGSYSQPPTKSFAPGDLKSGKEIWQLKAKEGIGSVLTLSSDGKFLASAGGRRTILLIDSRTGKKLHELSASSYPVDAISFSPDGQTLLACSDHQNMDRWRLATGKLIEHLAFEPGWAEFATLSPNGRLVAVSALDVATRGYTIRLWDLSAGREICRFPKPRDLLASSMSFSPDHRVLAWASCPESVVHLVEIATGQERCQFSGHKETIYSLAFSPDGKFLVSGAGDTTALVWDLTGRLAAAKDNAGQLTDSKLASYWQELQAEDGVKSYNAMQRLMADPARSVPYLGSQLQPAAKTDAAQLTRLIADLDSNQFAVRQKAAEELEKLGELAEPVLEKALASNSSPEAKRRAGPLLEKLRAPITAGPKLQTLRTIEVLEHIGTPEAQEVLQTLAKGAPEALITREAKASLDRLRKLAAPKKGMKDEG